MDLDVCDIDERKLLGAVLHTGHQGPGRINGCKDRYAGLDGVSADDKAIVAALGSLGRDVDDQVDLMSQDQIQDIGRLLLDLAHRDGHYALLVQVPGGSVGTEDPVALGLEWRLYTSPSPRDRG